MTKLHIFDGLLIPKDAVTQTMGILAIKDAGKTYCQLKMGEQFLKHNLPSTFIDSMGVCWGLRSSADGKGEGFPITIMGGEHADVPLVPTAGKVVADLIARENISCVLDISDFRKHEQKRFVLEFSEELYHKKKIHRSPMHLFLDEADLWAPQKPFGGDERLLGAIEDLVRRGRARGIGVTMATQRPAVLNKNVLSQISILIAMRMGAPQDIDAVDYWVKSNGTLDERHALLSSLPGLEKGQAWVWSPYWLKTLKKVRVQRRETFDSSKTPEIGEKIAAPKRLAPVDIEAIKAAIAATVEQAKYDDPRVMRAEIAALKKTLSEARGQRADKMAAIVKREVVPAKPTVKVVEKRVLRVKPVVRTIYVPVLGKRQRKVLARLGEVLQDLRTLPVELRSIEERLNEIDQENSHAHTALVDTVRDLNEWAAKKVPPPPAAPAPRPTPPPKPPPPTGVVRVVSAPALEGGDTLGPMVAGERKILLALKTFGGRATKDQVGLFVGLPINGSTFKTYVRLLKRRGYIGEDSGHLLLSADGNRVDVGPVAMPNTLQDLLDLWKSKFVLGPRQIIDFIAGRQAATREEIAGHLQVEADGSTIKTYLRLLKRCGLVVEEQGSFHFHPQLLTAFQEAG